MQKETKKFNLAEKYQKKAENNQKKSSQRKLKLVQRIRINRIKWGEKYSIQVFKDVENSSIFSTQKKGSGHTKYLKKYTKKVLRQQPKCPEGAERFD